MSVLVDKSILELIKEGRLEISPFEKTAITSNGCDLLLEDFELSPGEFKLIKSAEKVKIPEDIIAIPILRTTYAFNGLILSPGIIDAGYEGYLKFALYNSSGEKIIMEKKDIWKRAITLIFLKTSDKTNLPFGCREDEANNSL